MKYWADFHLHSKYSIATSKDSIPEQLAWWAQRKGVTLLGTGDFTHPGWRKELREKLEPAGDGLWRLKPDFRRKPDPELPHCPEPLFIVSGEISTIYKKNGRTHKLHHLVLLPGLEEADKLSGRLEKIGNLSADGRPILGLDSRDLLAIILETCPEAVYIPAHIWTPHFSLFGANSGFDTIEECYEDLAGEITAVETGLSSDPAMNWRLSMLDRLLLVSNSDAHSPRNLAREANLFATELAYPAVREALRHPERGFLGTVEFFPEEGKYHWDGHRTCGIRWEPRQTRENKGICPVCGRKVTVGVLHRVETLADREPGEKPAGARRYERLVPLTRVIAAAEGVGENTQKVEKIYYKLLAACGPELLILREIPLEEIKRTAGTLVAEGIRRVRQGLLEIKPGFDGEYGKVNIFRADERQAYLGQAALFSLDEPRGETRALPLLLRGRAGKKEDPSRTSLPAGLNREQQAAATAGANRVLVTAGPGTGKTRTLLHRVEFLLRRGAKPAEITCVTFTRKAAAEMEKRLRRLLPSGDRIRALTFHRLCLSLLAHCPAWQERTLLSEYELPAFFGEEQELHRALLVITRLKNRNILPGDPEVPEEWRDFYRRYQEFLLRHQVLDYDEIVLETVRLLEEKMIPRTALACCRHLLVDEFQDVTPLQYRLLKLLAREGETLFVIGDPDQSIYAFRGSDTGVFQRFREDFPGYQEIALRLNYRSTPDLVAAAQHLIARNRRPARVRVEPARPPGKRPAVSYLATSSAQAESRAVVREIVRLVGGTDMLSAHGDYKASGDAGGYSFGEIAVLFRTGRQVELLEKALLKEGLPYKVAGEKELLHHPRIRETVTYLHALLKPADCLVLTTLYFPCFFPGEEYIRQLEEAGRRESRPLFTAVQDFSGQNDLPALVREKLRYYCYCQEKFTSLLKQGTKEFLHEWIKERGWDGTAEMEQIMGMAALSSGPADFLERVLYGKEQDLEREGKRGPAPEYISLMTIHAAKGLEFPVVLITGLEEGLLPLHGGEAGEEEIEEERRLFYVALTRAQEEVILFSAGRRRGSGSSPVRLPSRFLQELPAEILRHRRIKQKKSQPSQPGLFPVAGGE